MSETSEYIQQRIWELSDYAYSSGIPENEIYLALDSTHFELPLKIPLSDLKDVLHKESNRLTSLGSSTITINFAESFSAEPIGYAKAYRWVEYRTGVWSKETVLGGYSAKPTADGFTYKIDDDENLTGVIFEYKFEEI
jgi:hypothetical protein